MATQVIYPSDLPCPTAAPVTPTERRLISDIPGEKQYRGLQRDFHGTQDLTWIFTAQEAHVFKEWWRLRLRRGGYWFAADWPLPSGNANNVYRFMAPPSWSYQGGGRDFQGVFTVTAKLEIRGRGMLPVDYVVPPMFTTPPYPLDPADSIDGAGDFLGGRHFFWPDDDMAASGDFSGGELRQALRHYEDAEPESLDVQGDFSGGTLVLAFILRTYDDGVPEEISAVGDFLGGSLRRALIQYDNYAPELVQSSGDFIGGTLTLG